MGRKADIIRKAIEEKLHEENVRVWYEPIHGPCMEMAGYAGGWYWSNEDESAFGEPLGYNLAEALAMVELTASLRKQSGDFDDGLARDEDDGILDPNDFTADL